MTNQEVKRIEDQIRDLQSIVDHYHKDHIAALIIEKEEELLGKAFKLISHNGEITYFKPVSMLDINTPYTCVGMKFELPINCNFKPRARLCMVRHKDFDLMFENDLILYMDTEEVAKLRDEYESISEEEYDAALANLMYQAAEFSKKYYTIKSICGAEYDTEIRNMLREEQGDNNEEKKE